MRPSPKQSKILHALRERKEITLDEAVALIRDGIYCNEQKHVGALLANMVKRGMIERARRGVFQLPVTARDGLLWRGEQAIPLPEADHIAAARGYHCAEQLVRALQTVPSGPRHTS